MEVVLQVVLQGEERFRVALSSRIKEIKNEKGKIAQVSLDHMFMHCSPVSRQVEVSGVRCVVARFTTR